MAALLDLLSKARVNNSQVPVTVRHGWFKVACCFAFPFREWNNLCSTNPWWFVCTTVLQAGSAHTGQTDSRNGCQSDLNPETQSRGQLRCTVVGQWRHRVLIRQRLCPADHTVLQLTLSQLTCVLMEWITWSLLKGHRPVSCPIRNRTFPTEQFVFFSLILVSTETE